RPLSRAGRKNWLPQISLLGSPQFPSAFPASHSLHCAAAGLPRWGDLGRRSRNAPAAPISRSMAASVATGPSVPESGVALRSPEVDADALIERSRERAATPLGDRDRLASLLLGGSFLAVSIALAALAESSRHAGPATIVVFV